MENFEMMNEDMVMEPEVEIYEAETEKSGLGGVALMAIGAVGMAAIGAAVTFGKKLWDKHKAKTELRQPEEDEPVEVTDEEIMEVVK